MHALSDPQDVGQAGAEPSHTYGLHDGLPALPAASTVHVPTVALSVHDWQPPVQAALQHTPPEQ
jgi:hypothetical protein